MSSNKPVVGQAAINRRCCIGVKTGWWLVILFTGFCVGNIALAYRAHCQAPTAPSHRTMARTGHFVLPAMLYGYVHQDSNGRINLIHPLTYRLATDSANCVSVSVSVVKPDSAMGTTVMLQSPVIQAHVKGYLDSLRIGLVRSGYEAARIAYRQVMDTTIQSVFIPGYTLAVVVRGHGEAVIRFAYWYVIQGWLLQIRATMPASEMATSTLPLFAREVISDVVRDVLGR